MTYRGQFATTPVSGTMIDSESFYSGLKGDELVIRTYSHNLDTTNAVKSTTFYTYQADTNNDRAMASSGNVLFRDI